MSNFDFLSDKWTNLATLGKLAEQYTYTDPASTIYKCRTFCETLAQVILSLEGMQIPDSQLDRIDSLRNNNIIDRQMSKMLHEVRKTGNRAIHEDRASSEEALYILPIIYTLATWFIMTYEGDEVKGSYVEPVPGEGITDIDSSIRLKTRKQVEELNQTIELYQCELEQLNQQIAELQKQDNRKQFTQRRERANDVLGENVTNLQIEVADIDLSYEQEKSSELEIGAYLSAEGFEVIDKRPSKGRLWVVDNDRFTQMQSYLKQIGYYFKQSQGRATHGRPGWYLVETIGSGTIIPQTTASFWDQPVPTDNRIVYLKEGFIKEGYEVVDKTRERGCLWIVHCDETRSFNGQTSKTRLQLQKSPRKSD